VLSSSNGSTSNTAKLGGDIGAVWGVTGAFLIVPAWKAVRKWSTRRTVYLLSGIISAALVVGVLIKIRADQIAKLDILFGQIEEVGSKGAPEKQEFMTLASENPHTLSDYLERCRELEPVLSDYVASEQQMDNLLIEVQQQIKNLKPRGSYDKMLPMLNVLQRIGETDLDGAKFYKQEIADAKQLPDVPEKNRAQYFRTQIEPVLEQEQQTALAELAIMKEAKARGIDMPPNMLEEFGLK